MRCREKQKWKKNECGNGTKSRKRSRTRSKGVDQEKKKDNHAKEPAGTWSGDCRNAITKIARGEEQHYGKKKGECEQSGREGTAAGPIAMCRELNE